ncbi:MAG: acetolactate synthase large subunit [Acidobacteriota bacterium]
MISGAESLLRTASRAGIEVCFANPGTTELPLVVALDQVSEVRPVLCLAEAVCTGAADGYGRMAGKPALTLLHLGPGLANGIAYLHDARRARSPIVNLVGEHATWHLAADPPLNMDIESLARPVSAWLRRNASADEMARDMADAITAAMVSPGQIATLILPHDYQIARGGEPVQPLPAPPPAQVGEAALRRAVEVIRTSRSPALFLGGSALSSRGLDAAARIAAATGCKLICETFPKRMERGHGTPPVERLPYFPEPAIALLEKHDAILLAGARDPVSFFGYPGLPSFFISTEQIKHTLATPFEDVPQALEALADALGTKLHWEPLSSAPVERPRGAITLETFAAAIAFAQPENAILMDEGNTSSFHYFAMARNAAPFSQLTQPGGAIGCGLPCATGAAIACPDRPIINLQADGSAMYTLQSLWTQAREGLNVTTVICNNGGYRVLGVEMQRAGVTRLTPTLRSMIGLTNPSLDFVALAAGMGVPGVRVERAEDLALQVSTASASPGPFLIEAVFS